MRHGDRALTEACLFRWQESLALMARLVETEILGDAYALLPREVPAPCSSRKSGQSPARVTPTSRDERPRAVFRPVGAFPLRLAERPKDASSFQALPRIARPEGSPESGASQAVPSSHRGVSSPTRGIPLPP